MAPALPEPLALALALAPADDAAPAALLAAAGMLDGAGMPLVYGTAEPDEAPEKAAVVFEGLTLMLDVEVLLELEELVEDMGFRTLFCF